MEPLRVVIQVFDDRTMLQNHGSARVVLSTSVLAMIERTSDTKNIAQWVASELSSIISCLEDVDSGSKPG